jgi:tRNA U34 5-carboxymethylaminomethyl modifying GTPase MnmE/TrmE
MKALGPPRSRGEIFGKTTTEDLLDAVFSQFCIGK